MERLKGQGHYSGGKQKDRGGIKCVLSACLHIQLI